MNSNRVAGGFSFGFADLTLNPKPLRLEARNPGTCMSSIFFGDTMVPILILGIVLYIRNIILLGSTTQKNIARMGDACTVRLGLGFRGILGALRRWASLVPGPFESLGFRV